MRFPFRLCFGIFVAAGLLSAATEPLQEFNRASYAAEPFNDGDSFAVRFERNGQKETHLIRLYFVDCFEAHAETDTDRQRLLEQTRYFGLGEENRKQGREFGERAAQRVQELLARPFTVHTAFKGALGRSKRPRIYAMITLFDGRDLAAVLIREGLARNFGIARKRPDGISAKDYKQHLADIELQAAAKREGAWKIANFDKIAEMREEQRREKRKVIDAVGGKKSADDRESKTEE